MVGILGKSGGIPVGDATINVSIYEDYVGELLLYKTLPTQLTPWRKHYPTKTIWFHGHIFKVGIIIVNIDNIHHLVSFLQNYHLRKRLNTNKIYLWGDDLFCITLYTWLILSITISIQEKWYGTMGWCISQRHNQCWCTAVVVGWWRGVCWRSCRGFTIGWPDVSRVWQRNVWRKGVGYIHRWWRH